MGFIGLGNMGLPMTGNLVKKGYQVKAFDISPQTLDKCAEYGVKAVSSIADVSQDVSDAYPPIQIYESFSAMYRLTLL